MRLAAGGWGGEILDGAHAPLDTDRLSGFFDVDLGVMVVKGNSTLNGDIGCVAFNARGDSRP